MRSIAEQGDAELGGGTSVLVRQKRDHEKLDRLLHQLEGVAGTGDEERVLRRINRLVFSHAFAEESVLWPVLRAVLPDGEALTLQVEIEHQEVNELVTRLEEGSPGDPGRRQTVERLVTVLRQDVRDEEDVLLPRLQAAVDRRRLRRLGVAWEAVRRTAPTRPHPTVSRRPPGNVLAAAPLTVLDRARDVVDAGVRHAPPRVAGALGRTSRALAHGAAAVERLSPLQAGERTATRSPRGDEG